MRVIITMDVPDDYGTDTLALDLDIWASSTGTPTWDSDATVWTFEQFFADLDEGVIGPTWDKTTKEAT